MSMSIRFAPPSSATMFALGASLAAYLSWVRLLRYRSWHRLESMLSPTTVEDAFPILENFMNYDYPLYTTLSLEIGFLKTYGIPSISTILAGTRELIDRPTKRIDDTNLIMREIVENPPSSERSLNAIRRMNALHSKYKAITNQDFLYVLAIFICEPMRLAELYGYRGVHPHEKKSSFLMFQHIGREMGLRSIHSSYEEAEAYMQQHELRHMHYSPKNAAVAQESIAVVMGLFPQCLHGALRLVLHTLAGPTLRTAMGFPTPGRWAEATVHAALSAAKCFTRLLLPPRTRFNHKRRTNLHALLPRKGAHGGCPFSTSSSAVLADPDIHVAVTEHQCEVDTIATFCESSSVSPDCALPLCVASSSAVVGAPYFNPYSPPAYPLGYRVEDVGPAQHRGQLGVLHSETSKEGTSAHSHHKSAVLEQQSQ